MFPNYQEPFPQPSTDPTLNPQEKENEVLEINLPLIREIINPEVTEALPTIPFRM